MIRDLFEICVAGGSEHFGQVNIRCVCIGRYVVIAGVLCVVRVAKKYSFFPQINLYHRYRG